MKRNIFTFLMLLGLSLSINAQSLFSEQIGLSTDYHIEDVQAKDIDNDGDLDLICAASEHILIWKNDGYGNFGSLNMIEIEYFHCTQVYLDDIDGDGDIDLFAAYYNDYTFYWYENDGQGNFAPHMTSILINARGTSSEHSADIDGDNDVDILITTFDSNQLFWIENTGNGNFEEKHYFAGDNYFGEVSCLSDLDNDGDMDVITSYSGDLYWYANDGIGNFGEKILIADIYVPKSVYTEDVDNDGDMDIILGSFNSVKLFVNNGNGEFSCQPIISNNSYFKPVFSADINQDGKNDIVSVISGEIIIAWFENLGNDNFSEKKQISNIDGHIRNIFSADLDGDSDMDVIAGYRQPGNLVWFKNLTYNFSQPQDDTVCINTSATFIASDMNNVSFCQWQTKIEEDWVNLEEGDNYLNINSDSLIILNVTEEMENSMYRCLITYLNGAIIPSNDASLLIFPRPVTASIVGNSNPTPNEVWTYSVENPNNSVFDWTIEGGTIASDNESLIDVLWGENGYGNLSVVEIDSNGCYGLPVQLPITIDVEEIPANYHIQVFPNPTKGKLQIQGENIQKIEIINIEGKLILSEKLDSKSIEIDLSKEAKGIYFIQFFLEEGIYSRRLILK